MVGISSYSTTVVLSFCQLYFRESPCAKVLRRGVVPGMHDSILVPERRRAYGRYRETRKNMDINQTPTQGKGEYLCTPDRLGGNVSTALPGRGYLHR